MSSTRLHIVEKRMELRVISLAPCSRIQPREELCQAIHAIFGDRQRKRTETPTAIPAPSPIMASEKALGVIGV